MQVHTTLNRLPSASKSASPSPSTSSTPAILPEYDPHPSWTFFHPSATYIPHTPCSPPSPLLSSASTAATSPRSSPTLSPNLHRQQQSSTPINNNSNNNKNIPSSTPSTHHRILDHCFHVSIETRLKQAEAQYLASTQEQAVEQQIKKLEELHQPPMSALKQDDWRRRQRTLVDEAVVLGRKGSNVEAIVDGILKSHRSSGPLQTLPRHLKHRLHLCQLTSMVFGRFDVASSTNNTAGLNIYSAFQSRHGASRAAIQQHLANSPQGQKTRSFFAQPVSSASYCRRHHRKDCQRTCCTLAKMQQQQHKALEQKKRVATANANTNANSNNSNTNTRQQRVAGLVDAIPAFLKCSAMSYRDIAQCLAEKHGAKDESEGRVLEGWYRLLLEMMTQAVIESYLCDGTTGVDTLLDVFSYGDLAEDEEEPAKDGNNDEGNSSNSSATEGTLNGRRASFQGQTNSNEATGITTQDRQDDILFVKTAEYEAFKKAKDDRLQEFLTMNGTSVEQHFVDVASKYPLIVLERQMTHYIARSQKLLVDPKLSRSAEDIGLLIPPATSAYADGSLSMPVSDDEDDEEMEEVTRLEEIKEEEEDVSPTPAVKAVEQQQVRVRHEKMKLATITSSIDDDTPLGLHHHHNADNWSYHNHNHNQSHGHGHARQHLPSPPPSEVASRSSTVSPQTSTASLSEEEESSITEAAKILVSNKKHQRHSSSSSNEMSEKAKMESFEDRQPEMKLGRAVKKMRV
ncbi:hypothetical protein KI688_009916 [Linnemannia hyalina]|uniref:Uncharacterized protein n=1 Tax=Linnemannia hyalina TaxID=64524 RepID=A0A9P8BVC8_9FUNG|nr:hypothetical protein KI688_009916 [Linnemannia hyalina]